MRLRHALYAALLSAALLLALSACGAPPPLLERVRLAPETITPNADGSADLTQIEFLLHRTATVTIFLEDAAGARYTFRPSARLTLNEAPYVVYFGGVVAGYTLPGESFAYAIPKRMLPDGAYTLTITADAVTANGPSDDRMAVSRALVVRDADTRLPGVRDFRAAPDALSPNQDGRDDETTLRLTLEKDVADLRVYLAGPEGVAYTIPPDSFAEVPTTAAGEHVYLYDGGFDSGSEPPPDGAYPVYAVAQDRMGQQVVASTTLTLTGAGAPQAYIVQNDVRFSSTTLVISETLCFTLTVENDSGAALRTGGPWPGHTYRSDQDFGAAGFPEDPGVFRVGMDFDTSLRNYPFRWGVGQPGIELVERGGQWYLPPYARAEITGCVQILDAPVRNPLYFWMGLLHEGMTTPATNNRVAPHFITIWEP